MTKRTKAKRIEAETRAVCREGDGEIRALEPTRHHAEVSGRHDASAGRFTIVHLVPANPAMERLAKAARLVAEEWRRERMVSELTLNRLEAAYRQSLQKKERKP